ILVCWVGKLLLLARLWFAKEGRTHDHPWKLTAALCAIFVAVFALLAFGAHSKEVWARNHSIRETPASPTPSHVSRLDLTRTASHATWRDIS
ncbi:MAG: hypothetical protein ABGY41_05475, partial [Candidatus Poribacteria bacterium]